MSFPESSFDAVIFVASLQFIEDYRKAITQATQVLRSNGKLIVMLLNPESAFFNEKLHDPLAYVSKIKHTDLKDIEGVIAEDFNVQTEYFLGVKGDVIFESADVADAVLYAIMGTRKLAYKEDRN